MSALATNTFRVRLGPPSGNTLAVPVKANAATFDGSLVALVAGLAVAAADNATHAVLGVAIRGYDNTGGADGVVDGQTNERFVEVDRAGIWEFAITGDPDPGQVLFVVNDNTLSANATTHSIPAGIFLRWSGNGTGLGFVDVSLPAINS